MTRRRAGGGAMNRWNPWRYFSCEHGNIHGKAYPASCHEPDWYWTLWFIAIVAGVPAALSIILVETVGR